jgi:hypothetical protein
MKDVDRVFKFWVLRGIFSLKKDGITGTWKILMMQCFLSAV